MKLLPLLLMTGCSGPEALYPTCDDPDTVGTFVGDLSAESIDGLCDGWCSLTVEGRVDIRLPLTAEQQEGLSCITAVQGQVGVQDSEASETESIVLESLRYVDGSLDIYGTEVVGRTDSFSQLTWVSGSLGIVSTSLAEISGLESLESVGSLSLYHNAQLVDISGLSALSEINGELVFSGNSCLPPEPIDALIEQIGEDNIGSLRIEDNGPC